MAGWISSQDFAWVRRIGASFSRARLGAIPPLLVAAILGVSPMPVMAEEIQASAHGRVGQTADASSSAQSGVTLDMSPEEREFLALHPMLRVGNETDYPPFDFAEDGDPRGYSIDVTRLLAQRLGIGVRFVTGPRWSELLAMARDKRLDVLQTISETDERHAFLNFTRGHLLEKFSVALTIREDETKINAVEDLSRRRLARPRDYAPQAWWTKVPDVEPLEVADPTEALRAVSEGRADAADIYGGGYVERYLIRKNHIPGLKVVLSHGESHGAAKIAVRDDWPLLPGLLDKALASLTEEELAPLRAKWSLKAKAVDDRVSPKRIEMSEAERDWVRLHPQIRVVANDRPPFLFAGANGPEGYSYDVLNASVAKIGLSLSAVSFAPLHEVLRRIRDGEADLATNIIQTPERARFMEFSEPYTISQDAIVAPAAFRYPWVGALSGKRVAVVRASVQESILAERKDVLVVPCEGPLECLEFVVVGKADAAFENLAVVDYLIAQHQLTALRVSGVAQALEGGRFGIRKGEKILSELLNRAMADLSESERRAIAQKWFSPDVAMAVTKLAGKP